MTDIGILAAVTLLLIGASWGIGRWHDRQQDREDEAQRRKILASVSRDETIAVDQYRRERAPQLASLQTRAAKGIDARRHTVLGHTEQKERA